MNFLGLSLAYSLSKTFILARPGLFKSLVWFDSLFKSFLRIKSLISWSRRNVIGKLKENETLTGIGKQIKIMRNIKGHMTHT